MQYLQYEHFSRSVRSWWFRFKSCPACCITVNTAVSCRLFVATQHFHKFSSLPELFVGWLLARDRNKNPLFPISISQVEWEAVSTDCHRWVQLRMPTTISSLCLWQAVCLGWEETLEWRRTLICISAQPCFIYSSIIYWYPLQIWEKLKGNSSYSLRHNLT